MILLAQGLGGHVKSLSLRLTISHWAGIIYIAQGLRRYIYSPRAVVILLAQGLDIMLAQGLVLYF